MLIEGKKNYEFLKRALLSHMVTCSHEHMRADDKKAKEVLDPELETINKWLDAVEVNLAAFEDDDTTGIIVFPSITKAVEAHL